MRSPILAALLLVSILVAGAIGIAILLRGPGSTAPIDSLPRDTSLLLRAQDPRRLLRGLSLTGKARQGVAEAPDEMVGLIDRIFERHGIPIAPTEVELARILSLETIVALVPGDREEPEGIAVVLDMGRRASEAPEMARRYTQASPGAPSDTTWTSRTYHGRAYQTLRLPGGEGGLNVAGLKGLGVFTTTGASMRRILDTIDGRVDSLRFEPAYRATRDRFGKRSDAFAYVSGKWLAGEIDRRLGAGQVRRALRLMGLDAVRALGLEIDVRKGLFRERLFVALQNDRRPLPVELFDTPPGALSPSSLIPDGLPYQMSLTFSNLDAVYQKLPRILASATGGDRKALQARLEGFEQFMAIDLDRDLFGALGGEMVIGFGGGSPYPRSAPNRSLLGTPVVTAVALRSPSKAGALLARMDGLARAMSAYRSVELDGQTMTGYDFRAIAPWSPSYRVTRGHLIAATSPDLLARALNAGTRHLSFADREEIGSLAALLPDRAHVYFFGDTARIADFAQDRTGTTSTTFLSETVRAGLARLGQEPGPSPTAVAARVTSEGYLLEGVSPLSPSVMLWLLLESALEDQQETTKPQEHPPADEIPF